MQKPIRKILSTAILAVLANQATHAGGFSLYTEGSAAAIGNFAAGIAAEGADASIGWFNPAGLVLMKKQQLLLSGVGVLPSSKLSGTSTYSTTNPFDPTGPSFEYFQSYQGLQGAENAVVPALHYALPLGERAVFGLSIVSPFGLSTNYHQTSPVRYAATLSKLQTVTVAPELGGKITDDWSIGAGLDLQYADVKFNRVIGSPAAMSVGFGFPATAIDSESYNTGNSFGVGFHAGTLFMFNEQHTRVGLNYQSQITHQFYGSSQLKGPLADPALNIFEPEESNPNSSYSTGSLYSNDITLPNIITLSAYHDLNNKLALLGSAVYSTWSSFKTITLNNVAIGAPLPDGSGTLLTTANSTSEENYRDTWRFAVGANYHVTDQWMMRIGGGYDQTPTVNSARDVRLPDADRWALSVGAHYQMRPSLGFDLGYTYLFTNNDAPINNTSAIGATSSYNVSATTKAYAQLVGLQAVWTID